MKVARYLSAKMAFPAPDRDFSDTSEGSFVTAASDCVQTSGYEIPEDWTQNHVILAAIFRHLRVPDLKLARLVCKFWAQIAAIPLAGESVSRITPNFKRDGIPITGDLSAFLESNGTKVWDSGFKTRNMELENSHVKATRHCSMWSKSWHSFELEDLEPFVASDQFQTVTSLRLNCVGFNEMIVVMLPHWLPTHWRKLKTLKLTKVSEEFRFVPPQRDPPSPPESAQVDLERLFIQFTAIYGLQKGHLWEFLKYCYKLKHLHLHELFPLGGIPEIREAHLKSILQALGQHQLDVISLGFSADDDSSLDSWKPSTSKLVTVNGRNLKSFALKFYTTNSNDMTFETLAPTWKLAPSVKIVKFQVNAISQAAEKRAIFAQLLPHVYHLWNKDGRRIEFFFAYSGRDNMFKLIVQSPKDLILHLNNLHVYRDKHLLLPSVLQNTFPEINYVCCAKQLPIDGAGFSYETTLLERFGKEGVFDLETLLAEEFINEAHQEDGTLPKDHRTAVFDLEEINMMEPKTLQEATIAAAGWSQKDLKVKDRQVFVFAQMSQKEMAEAWAKVQNRPCTFKSVKDDFTPEVVRSGQGSYAALSKFTTSFGPSNRFRGKSSDLSFKIECSDLDSE